jgi:hypothetical protein
MMRVAALLLFLIAALAAAGCGVGSGDSKGGGVSLTVTRDFGTRRVGSESRGEIPGGETVMRLLQRKFDVETRYGGGFVQKINGIAGGREQGRPVDWFYYVNGVLADDGAAAHKISPGDHVWWDHHDWGATPDVRAVIGAFPEPFLSGEDGKRLPVRLDCASDAADACDEVAKRLTAAGVKVAGRSAAGSFGGEGLLRVEVGRWPDVRKDPAVRQLEKGPRLSGVFARPSPAGDRIALLDSDGKPARTAGPGSGLVAATRIGGEAPTWIVTGTDTVGVAAAAAQLDEAALRNHFAVAVERGRATPLPLVPPPEAP